MVVSSRDRKAIETAALVAEALGLPLEEAHGLHEHDRGGTGWLESEHFLAAMDLLFAHPGEVVFGHESADAAHARFSLALGRVERKHHGTLVVVTHGTVMSFYAAAGDASDARAVWKRLGLPALLVFERPSHRLVQSIERI